MTHALEAATSERAPSSASVQGNAKSTLPSIVWESNIDKESVVIGEEE